MMYSNGLPFIFHFISQEKNCIDVSSDVEYEDDDGDEGHDIVHGKPRCAELNQQNNSHSARSSPVNSEHCLLNHKDSNNHVVPQIHVTDYVSLDVIAGNEDKEEEQPLIEDDIELKSMKEKDDVKPLPTVVDTPMIEISPDTNAENA